MDTIFKVAAVGVAGTLMAVTLKRSTPEIGLALGLFVACGIVLLGMDVFGAVLDFMRETARLSRLPDGLLSPLFKTVGISIVTKISAELCRDAKESAIASGIEICGAVAGLYAALPLFRELLSIVSSLV